MSTMIQTKKKCPLCNDTIPRLDDDKDDDYYILLHVTTYHKNESNKKKKDEKIEELKKGRFYNDEEATSHQIDIKHSFHDTEETFEVYKCPKCSGHFLVESDAVESISVMWCPYCKFEFVDEED